MALARTLKCEVEEIAVRVTDTSDPSPRTSAETPLPTSDEPDSPIEHAAGSPPDTQTAEPRSTPMVVVDLFEQEEQAVPAVEHTSGDLLKKLRVAHGWTHDELSAIAKVSV